MALGKKTGGRKKGTANKNTAEVRKRIMQIMDKCYSLEKIEEDLLKVNASTRLKFYAAMLPYVCAKPKEDADGEDEGLTREEAIDRLLSTYQGKN